MKTAFKQWIPTAWKDQAREWYWHLRSDPAKIDYLFIHINKNGGTSIERAIRLPQHHLTARELQAEVGSDRWETAFKFTIVRNPWSRMVSLYHYRMRQGTAGLADQAIAFPDWVEATLSQQDPVYYNNTKMFLPQVDWLQNADGVIDIDFIGRFERLNADFTEIARQLGSRATLPHMNASQHRHYSSYYTPAATELVRTWFAADIEAFGYEFEAAPRSD